MESYHSTMNTSELLPLQLADLIPALKLRPDDIVIKGHFTNGGSMDVVSIIAKIEELITEINSETFPMESNFMYFFFLCQTSDQIRDREQCQFFIQATSPYGKQQAGRLKQEIHQIYRAARGIDYNSPFVYPNFISSAAALKTLHIATAFITFLRTNKRENVMYQTNNTLAESYFKMITIA